MADTGIFATTAEIGYKAGANKSSTSSAEAYTNSFIAQAESFINVTTRFNWSDAYSGLNADVKALLKEAGSNIAAMYVVAYDMSGYASLGEAQTLLDLLWNRAQECIKLLADWKQKDFISGA
jgi:hypothetical protein